MESTMISSFKQKSTKLPVGIVLLGSILLLGGCVDDGEDGAVGATGATGATGAVSAAGSASLKRLATAPVGAEFTGLFLNTDGALFLNIQHPSDSNATVDNDGKTFNKGTVGVITGTDFNSLGNIAAMDMPVATPDKEVVMTAVGQYKVLVQQADALNDGNKMGDILASDGTTVIKSSNDPDFNAAVPDGDGGYYLYSNWEDRPGSMSRIKISPDYATVTAEGMLDFSSGDGTCVNCFGTLSPWRTPLSSEELYFDNTADWFDPDYKYFSNAEAIAEYKG
ncbi:MAG: cell surface protein, partial [Colwellia sp.]|nr:cell surface protein [Colwellia sp.]